MLRRIINRVKETVAKETPDTPAPSNERKKTAPQREVKSEVKKEVWEPGAKRRKSSPKPKSDTPAPQGKAAASSEPAEPRSGQGETPSRPGRRRRRKPAGQRRPTSPSQTAAVSGDDTSASEEAHAPARTVPGHTPKNIASFEGQVTFADMPIADSVKQALDDMHFKVTTPIQARLLPLALDGRDAAGKAQTGTGKTAAFLIAMFTRFLKNPIQGERPNGTPRGLILAPTRELALQITKDANDIGHHSGLCTVAVYGGMDFDKQQKELDQPVDTIVATPGRLMDFVSRKKIDLRRTEVLVIDEADRMLDMGFIPDVRKIVRMTPHPEKRQTLMFSATLTSNIMRLAEQWTRNAETIEIEPERVAAESVNQRVFITTQEEKFCLLYNLLRTEEPERVIVFSNRRDQAEMLNDHLQSYGFSTALLSGAVDQKKRVRVLDDFKAGKVKVLVATDVAGRGLHVEGISHVINFHMPMDPDDYVHRIGRTGRAGELGTSISFACEMDSFMIPDIEEFIGHPLNCEHPDDELLKPLPEANYRVQKRPRKAPAGGRPRSRSGPRRGGGGGGRATGGRRR